jgi:hypothetical protein
MKKIDSLENLEKENLAIHAELSADRHQSIKEMVLEVTSDIDEIKQELENEKKFISRVITISIAVLTCSALASMMVLDKLR